MSLISTFVFVDVTRNQNTTGSSMFEYAPTNELAMIAAHRGVILSASKGNNHLVYDKLVLNIKLEKSRSEIPTSVATLSNDNLETPADLSDVRLIRQFLRRQDKPVCFVAHGENKFDFPILRTVIDALPYEYCCVNSKDMFRELGPLRYEEYTNKDSENRMKRKSYIYEIISGNQPINFSSAEDSCNVLLETSIIKGAQFVEWCNNKNNKYSLIPQNEFGNRIRRN